MKKAGYGKTGLVYRMVRWFGWRAYKGRDERRYIDPDGIERLVASPQRVTLEPEDT